MSPEFASRLARKLTASTGGWDDAATTELMNEITSWRNEQAAVESVMSMCRNWTGFRPTLGDVVAAYRSACDRQQREMPRPLPPVVDVPDFATGIKRAAQDYERECRLRGREPDGEFFAKWVSGGLT